MLKPVLNSESVQRIVKEVTSRSVVESRFPQSSEIAEIIAVEPRVSAVSCEVADGRVNYGGKLVLTIVYSDEEGKLCRMQKGAEFSHYCDDDAFTAAYYGVCALKCDKLTFRRDGSSFVLSAIIAADICVYARAERNYLASAAEEGEEITPNDCAVSVFLPSEGDELWDVAKKLGKAPSDVVACNPELKFPLCGKERILIYRSKSV